MIKIKSKIFIVLLLVIVSVLAGTATAALETTDTQATLLVDYAGFDTEDQETITEATNAFTLQNTGDTEINVTVTAEGLPTDYSATSKDVVIAANSSAEVTLNIDVPHDKDPGEENIGTIKAVSGTDQITLPLIQDTKSMLVINKIEVDYTDEDADSQDNDFDAEDEDDNEFTLDNNVRPGTNMQIKLKIENLFPDKDYDEGKIKDISLEIDVSDNDLVPSDFEEQYDLDNLEPDKDQSLTIDFDIEDDAPADSYDIEFTLEGKDRNNVKYKVVKTVSFDLERADDDVRITKARLIGNNIDCDADSFMFEVEIQNMGVDNQRSAAVSVYNKELGINENIQNIELDEFDDDDDTWSKTFTFDVPEEIEAKTYQIDVKTYINRDDLMDSELVNVDIVCSDDQTSDDTDNTNQNNNTSDDNASNTTVITSTLDTTGRNDQTNTANDPISSNNIVQTVEDTARRENTLLMIVFIVGIVLITLMIIIFLAILLKR